jgi:hypothetical protein
LVKQVLKYYSEAVRLQVTPGRWPALLVSLTTPPTSAWSSQDFPGKLGRFSIGGAGMPEFLYPRLARTRFSAMSGGIPAVCMTVLPHLSDDPDQFFDALAAEVPSWPDQPAAQHCARLFAWLSARFGGTVAVERFGLLPRLDPLNAPADRDYLMSLDLPVARFATLWSELVRAGVSALSGLPAEASMTLSYEDLMADPQERLSELAGFIGVTHRPRAVARADAAVLDPRRAGAAIRLPHQTWTVAGVIVIPLTRARRGVPRPGIMCASWSMGRVRVTSATGAGGGRCPGFRDHARRRAEMAAASLKAVR